MAEKKSSEILLDLDNRIQNIEKQWLPQEINRHEKPIFSKRIKPC